MLLESFVSADTFLLLNNEKNFFRYFILILSTIGTLGGAWIGGYLSKDHQDTQRELLKMDAILIHDTIWLTKTDTVVIYKSSADTIKRK